MAKRNIALFRSEDYQTIKSLLSDDPFPESFDEWRKATDKQIAELSAGSIVLVKVVVDPQEFVAFCKASGFECDTASLGAFTVYRGRMYG
jgi:hypothetical protein